MKIVQLTPYYLPHTGGIERYVFNLSTFLAEKGHEVEIITSNRPQSQEFEHNDGITVRRLPCIGEPLKSPITPRLPMMKGIIRDCDILHVHNIYSWPAMCGLYFKKRYAIPVLLTHHGQHSFGQPGKDFVVDLYRNYIETRILRSMDRVVVLTPSDARYISAFGISDRNISVIPNAINPGDFSGDPEPAEEFRERYGIGNRRIVLFVGQISRRKGVDHLIAAIPLITRQMREDRTAGDVVFVCIGSGDFLNPAQELAQKLGVADRVIFTGPVPFGQLLQAYRTSDVYVLPSLSEGMPTTILESMFFGLAVVTTSLPGLVDYFRDIALLVPPKDVDQLAGAIRKILTDTSLRRSLAEKGKRFVMDNCTWAHCGEQYVSLYRELIDSRPPPPP